MFAARDQHPLTQVLLKGQPPQASSLAEVSQPPLSKIWISRMINYHNAREANPQEGMRGRMSAPKKPQLRFSPKSTKMTSGPLFRSSTLSCTMKNKNNKSLGTKRESVWSAKSWIGKSKPKIKKPWEKMTRIKSTMKWRRSITSSRRSERRRRLMPPWRRSWMTSSPGINNSIKKNVERKWMRKTN